MDVASQNRLPARYNHATTGRKKTIGKQIAYTTKPFFYKWFNRFLANRVTKNIVMAAQAGVSVLPPQMRQALDQVTASAGGRNDPVQQLRLLRNVRNSYELQARLMPYKSTFDDFNDRVIQFGYLVLFAPAFPLAPFLALLNNIVEIRTSGYKLTRAYQRPQWKPRSGIGSWLGVLNVLGFLAVLTNASMITFVGDQDAKTYGIFKDDGTDGECIAMPFPAVHDTDTAFSPQVLFLVPKNGSFCGNSSV
eukprot:COSAG05_NODE_2006_length_3716_cov_1.634504_4_plen_249_part_00